jgi:hypothetical protein
VARTVTLAALRSQARQRADMVNSTFITDSEFNQYINNSATELYDLLIQKFGNEYFLLSTSISTLPSVDSYDLPTDFYKLVGVDMLISGQDYVSLRPFMFSERNLNNANVSRTIYGIPDVRYRLTGSKIKLTPIPNATSAIRLWYIPILTEMSTDAGTIDGINGWEEYVVVDAAIKALQKEESDVSVLMAQKQALIKRVEEAAENRDAGAGDRVGDVRRSYYDYAAMWVT